MTGSNDRPRAVLGRVPISKLRAREINPRTRFEGLGELAAEFDDNPVYPGEPWTPIMVVRDGDVFRIVDGERRFRAMREAGKVAECNAYVFDSMEDAIAALVMLDTDRKQPLTEGERSAGLQTALLLGVPEDKVEARAGSRCAAAMRRQIDRNGGKAAQMSIGQMLAADEFADDEDAYRRIVEADDGSWLRERDRLRRERDRAKQRAEAEEAAAEMVPSCGLQVADKAPRGAILERTLYSGAAEAIRRDGREWAAMGCILVRPHDSGYGYETPWEVYSMPPERTPEEEAAAKTRNGLRRQASAGRRRRLEWVAERMRTAGANNGLPNVRRFTRDYILEHRMWDAEEFCKKADMDSDFFNDSGAYRIACEYVIADSWEQMDHLTNAEVDMIGDGTAKDSKSARAAAEQHVKLLNALKQDGYKPSDEESAFSELCAKAIG